MKQNTWKESKDSSIGAQSEKEARLNKCRLNTNSSRTGLGWLAKTPKWSKTEKKTGWRWNNSNKNQVGSGSRRTYKNMWKWKFSKIDLKTPSSITIWRRRNTVRSRFIGDSQISSWKRIANWSGIPIWKVSTGTTHREIGPILAAGS